MGTKMKTLQKSERIKLACLMVPAIRAALEGSDTSRQVLFICC